MIPAYFASCDDKFVLLGVVCHGATINLATNFIKGDLINIIGEKPHPPPTHHPPTFLSVSVTKMA